MSGINLPNNADNANTQPASVNDYEWYHPETDKAPIAKKSEYRQIILFKYIIYWFCYVQAVIVAA